MTEDQISWASGDVHCLFELYDQQIEAASASQVETCKSKSEVNTDFLRSAVAESVAISSFKIGKFIGHRGSNLRRLEMVVPNTFFQTREGGLVTVYATNARDLKRAVGLLAPYK